MEGTYRDKAMRREHWLYRNWAQVWIVRTGVGVLIMDWDGI
jgi:hypothetical protein